jgi:cyclase
VVAHGGAGSIRDFSLAIKSGASAVAAGSLFVYYTLRKGVLINYIHSETLGDDLIAITGDQ